MKLSVLFLFALCSILFSCSDSNENAKKELDLKEKELALKEKELAQNEKATQLKVEAQAEEEVETEAAAAKENPLSNIENLIGNWFIPHAATTKISFMRDGRFEFNDYNDKLEKDELLTGTYELENGTLSLLYDDRPKQKFKFYKGNKGDNNYYIEKGAYYFVKGENGN